MWNGKKPNRLQCDVCQRQCREAGMIFRGDRCYARLTEQPALCKGIMRLVES